MTVNNTLSKIVVFAAGVAVGSVVTWKLLKTKYERITQEEIESVKEFYAQRAQVKMDTPADIEPTGADDKKDYDKIIEEANYVTESSDEIQNNEEEDKEMDRPYVISPEEFDENGYETISLTYYADNVLVDEFGGVIEEELWEEMVGADFAEHFGEYEDDSVFVRNDSFSIDYEILKDLRNYSEVE